MNKFVNKNHIQWQMKCLTSFMIIVGIEEEEINEYFSSLILSMILWLAWEDKIQLSKHKKVLILRCTQKKFASIISDA